MVILIAEIEGNCFYIILSILLVWHRSDLFNVSLQITGHVSLHNQMPLHITLNKLVFTSHRICFWYIMICPVSSAYTIGVASFAWPRYISYLLWTGHWSGYLFPGYLFPALFANHSLYFYVSSPCVTCFFSFAFTVCRLTLKGRCFGFIVSDTVC